jgi:hypothetical protein
LLGTTGCRKQEATGRHDHKVPPSRPVVVVSPYDHQAPL